MNRRSEWIGALFMPFLIAGAFVYFMWTDRLPEKPDVTLSLSDIASAYRENVVAAEAQYKGLAVATTGQVVRVGKFGEASMVGIDISDVGDATDQARCQIGSRQHDIVATLRRGTVVEVLGRYLKSRDGIPTLFGCQIKRVGRNVLQADLSR